MSKPKTMETRRLLSLPPELAAAIDEFRFSNRYRTESEALRTLIRRGLESFAETGGTGEGTNHTPPAGA